MFDSWVGPYSDRVLRRLQPPRPVLIDMDAVLPGGVRVAPTRVARQLYVKGAGARFETTMAGVQVAWLQADTGDWRALVRVELLSGNGMSRLAVQLLARPQDIAIDTAANRARLGLDELRRPPRTP